MARALALRPQMWRHGETENFIFHYRGLSDALQIAREIEFDLWYVAQSLGVAKADYTKKSHVYVFADEKEWQQFLGATHAALWAHRFAMSDELFLNVRAGGGGFDSQTLAHEMKFVRYLYNKDPHELFTIALSETYGADFSDMNDFEKRFSRFTR